ncbi:MAG: phosphotransferase [Gaiellaceae bacterium]
MDHELERPLTGGWVTSGVVRVGQTVRRPRTSNAPFVERLLRHLEEAGFEAAPRHLGLDEQGREILTFIEGDVPSDCRTVVWRDEQLGAIAELLRRFHDATAGSEIAGGTEVVCHNDFGPWNLVWREGLPVGIIDYDNAAPGPRLDDFGYALWKAVNLGLIDLPVSEQRRRTTVFTTAYGMIIDSTLLGAVERAQERMRELITAAPVGVGRDDALEQIHRERDWLEANGSQLIP